MTPLLGLSLAWLAGAASGLLVSPEPEPFLAGALLAGLAAVWRRSTRLAAPAALLAAPAAALTWLLSSAMAAVVQLWAQAPYASVPVPTGELLWLALYAPATTAAMFLSRRSVPFARAGNASPGRSGGWTGSVRRHPAAAGAAALSLAAAAVWTVALAPAPALTVHFLAVPSGASILSQGSDGRRILVDGGSSGPVLVRLLSEVLPPWERTIDLVVLTNPKREHVAELLTVLQRYDVRAVAESGLPGDTPEYAEWQRLLAERGLTPATLRHGMQITLGDSVVLNVLHPTEPWLRNVRTGVDRSDTSVVLELRAHGQRVLLASGVRARAVLALADRGLLAESAVLQLPASSDSASLTLLRESLRPAAVVLSGSELELSRVAPVESLDTSGVQVLRSDWDGTVRLTITPEGGVARGTLAHSD